MAGYLRRRAGRPAWTLSAPKRPPVKRRSNKFSARDGPSVAASQTTVKQLPVRGGRTGDLPDVRHGRVPERRLRSASRPVRRPALPVCSAGWNGVRGVCSMNEQRPRLQKAWPKETTTNCIRGAGGRPPAGACPGSEWQGTPEARTSAREGRSLGVLRVLRAMPLDGTSFRQACSAPAGRPSAATV